jgi:hypothetical protein
MPMPGVALILKCSACGSKNVTTRPDWREHKAPGAGRGQRLLAAVLQAPSRIGVHLAPLTRVLSELFQRRLEAW